MLSSLYCSIPIIIKFTNYSETADMTIGTGNLSPVKRFSKDLGLEHVV